MEPSARETIRTPNRVDELVPTNKHERPDHSEFIRTQTELMQTMLKAMIVASGWRVEGLPDGPP